MWTSPFLINMQKYAALNSNLKCHPGTFSHTEEKALQGSEWATSLFYPDASAKQACLQSLPPNSSCLVNCLLEQSQELAGAATGVAE